EQQVAAGGGFRDGQRQVAPDGGAARGVDGAVEGVVFEDLVQVGAGAFEHQVGAVAGEVDALERQVAIAFVAGQRPDVDADAAAMDRSPGHGEVVQADGFDGVEAAGGVDGDVVERDAADVEQADRVLVGAVDGDVGHRQVGGVELVIGAVRQGDQAHLAVAGVDRQVRDVDPVD